MASIKDLKRMCKTQTFCADCPLNRDDSCIPYSLPDNVDEIVDKWVSEHPVKTYSMDFFEKFPNASKGCNRIPVVCWALVYGDGKHCPSDVCNCTDCWNQLIPEDT